jgi:hypothetical protein
MLEITRKKNKVRQFFKLLTFPKRRTLKISFLIFTLFFTCFILKGEDFFKLKKQIEDNFWKKIGFLYITPTLSLQNFGYTSNIYWQSETDVDDWIADVGVKIDVSTILKNRFILRVIELPSYALYLENKEEQAFNNIFHFRVYTYLGRFNLKYELEKPNIRNRPTSEFDRPVRQNNDFNTLSLEVGSYDSFYISVYFKRLNFKYKEENYLDEYDLASFLNREESWAGIGLNKVIFTRTILSLNYEYFQERFEYSSERNREGHQVSLGIQFPEISSIKGSLKYGIKSFLPEDPIFEDFYKPFGSGNISILFYKRLKFKVNYQFDNFYSYYGLTTTFYSQGIGAGVEYYLSKNFKIGYMYTHDTLSYKDPVNENLNRKDQFNRSTFSLGIKVFKKTGVGLMYARYRGVSTLEGFNRKYNFIGGYIINEF